jgi:hypothetical protein
MAGFVKADSKRADVLSIVLGTTSNADDIALGLLQIGSTNNIKEFLNKIIELRGKGDDMQKIYSSINSALYFQEKVHQKKVWDILLTLEIVNGNLPTNLSDFSSTISKSVIEKSKENSNTLKTIKDILKQI